MFEQKLSSYGKSFQLKVLKALLKDKKFLLNVREILDREYFDIESHKWVIDQIIQYFDQYHTTLSLDVLKVELKKITNEVLLLQLQQELKSCFQVDEEDSEYIQQQFTLFCKNQKMKNAILTSTDLLQKGDFDGIRDLIEQALRAGEDRHMGHEYEKDVETRYRDDDRIVIPTPWETINLKTQGGIGSGDLVLVLASSGEGKSWFMIAIAGHAAKLGYNVNYYTLELSETYVGKRIDSYYTGLDVTELKNKKEVVEQLTKNLKGKVTVKEYPPKTASINTIKNHVKKCEQSGRKPDLIIIDYADYLRVPKKTRYTDKKDEIDDVIIGCKTLAKQLNIPVVSPSQVNRAGANDKVVKGDKIAGSYDKIMIGDITLSFTGKRITEKESAINLHFIKNRYGPAGSTYKGVINKSNGHIEITEEVLEEEESQSTSKVIQSFFNSH